MDESELPEANDEWQLQHCTMQQEGMAGLVQPTVNDEADALPSARLPLQAA